MRDLRHDAAALVPKRRAQLKEPAAGSLPLGATGAHPWSPWQEQRIIDTPHYRVRDELLRYVVWRNNTFGIHVHVAINGPDRAVQVCDALRAYLPELLALSASSPFLEHVNTGLHSVRTEIFTKFFPRCGVPDVYGSWDTFEEYVRFLFDTGSIQEHTEMWWSVRPHLAFPTVEIRICDAQPLQEEAISLAALAYSLTARIARALDEGENCPSASPGDRRTSGARSLGLSDADDLRRTRCGLRERRSRADRLGAARRRELGAAELAVRRRTQPSGRSRASRKAPRSRRSTRSRFAQRRRPSVAEESELSQEELLEHIRQMKVSDVLLSMLPTIAQLGYAKLDPEGRDLEQAKLAIETLRALTPVLAGSVPEEVLHDFDQATANLQLAYAKAVDEAAG